MLDFSTFTKDTILITPCKERLIEQKGKINPSLNIKFLSKDEILKGVYFDYDFKAVTYLHKKGYSFDNAIEILNSLRGIKDRDGKLHQLKEIYDELFSNYLLSFNPYFKHLFSNKEVYIYRYSPLDQELVTALNKLGIKYSFIKEDNNNYPHEVVNFATIDEELDFVFGKIGYLLNHDFTIDKIKFYSLPSEYVLPIKKYSHKHHIPFEKKESYSLYTSPVFKLFLSHLNDKSIEEAYEETRQIYSDDKYGALDKIISIATKLSEVDLDKEDYIQAFIYNAKNISLRNTKYENVIEYVSSLDDIDDSTYVFMLGFSQGTYPPIAKDTDFYSDEEKKFLGLIDVVSKNKIEEEKLTSFINRTKNLIITYKEKIGKTVYFKSLLTSKLQLKETNAEINALRYSYFAMEEEAARMYDLYHEYGIVSPFLGSLSEKQIGYKSYSHKFKYSPNIGVNEFLKLSYSSIDDYNTCPFKYFIGRVLKANIFEERFSVNLGNYYHLLLENNLNHRLTKEQLQEEYDKVFVTAKDRFFAEKLLTQLDKVLEKNENFQVVSKYKTQVPEQKIQIKLDDNTVLEGKIDKTLINEEDKELAIVDYKTYGFTFDKRKVPYGLDLQLPIYYLLSHEKYKDYTIAGLYIQQILVDDTKEVEKPYYLDGLTINDETVASHLDATCADSHFIVGLKKTSNGYLKNGSHVIIQDDLDQIIDTTKAQIDNTILAIRDGMFNIAPKLDKEFSSPCSKCPCIDICYKDYRDNVYIKLPRNGKED